MAALLQESADELLLETGDRLLLESVGALLLNVSGTIALAGTLTTVLGHAMANLGIIRGTLDSQTEAATLDGPVLTGSLGR